MAVGIPAKRRKLAEEERRPSSAAAVASSLGRKVRVYRSSMASGRSGGALERPGSAWTTIRVVFPDHFVLEAKFGRWEALQKLVDLLRTAISIPDRPFYIYTAPPKEKILDLAVDFLSAGLIPGAVVYFGCDDSASSEPWPFFLREEVRSMEGHDYDSDIL